MPEAQAPDLMERFPSEDLPAPGTPEHRDLTDQHLERAKDLIERHDLQPEDLAAIQTFQLTGLLRNTPMAFYGISDPEEAIRRAFEEHGFAQTVLKAACGYDEGHYGQVATLFSVVSLHMMSPYEAKASDYGIPVEGVDD